MSDEQRASSATTISPPINVWAISLILAVACLLRPTDRHKKSEGNLRNTRKKKRKYREIDLLLFCTSRCVARQRRNVVCVCLGTTSTLLAFSPLLWTLLDKLLKGKLSSVVLNASTEGRKRKERGGGDLYYCMATYLY